MCIRDRLQNDSYPSILEHPIGSERDESWDRGILCSCKQTTSAPCRVKYSERTTEGFFLRDESPYDSLILLTVVERPATFQQRMSMTTWDLLLGGDSRRFFIGGDVKGRIYQDKIIMIWLISILHFTKIYKKWTHWSIKTVEARTRRLEFSLCNFGSSCNVGLLGLSFFLRTNNEAVFISSAL